MQQCGHQFAAHPLPETELTHRTIQQILQLQPLNQFIQPFAEIGFVHTVYLAQQME
ncbi:hypothetical protein D3C76_1439250 [compost metagenome]